MKNAFQSMQNYWFWLGSALVLIVLLNASVAFFGSVRVIRNKTLAGRHLDIQRLSVGDLAVLNNRKLWNKTVAVEQDRIILLVAQQMAADFEHVHTLPYSCGGQEHRIATFKHKKSGLLLNLIPGGQFKLGSTSRIADDNERAIREITIPAMLVGQTEVTQKAWTTIGCKNQSRTKGELHPVERVSWQQCQEFLSLAGSALRLPSEAEWECACRAGTESQYCYGDRVAELAKFAWYEENSGGKSHVVGQKLPNAFGLFDTHGNVDEWCADYYSSSYKDLIDHKPCSVASLDRSVRSGSWLYPFTYCRSSNRLWYEPNDSHEVLGFRVFRSLSESRSSR